MALFFTGLFLSIGAGIGTVAGIKYLFFDKKFVDMENNMKTILSEMSKEKAFIEYPISSKPSKEFCGQLAYFLIVLLHNITYDKEIPTSMLVEKISTNNNDIYFLHDESNQTTFLLFSSFSTIDVWKNQNYVDIHDAFCEEHEKNSIKVHEGFQDLYFQCRAYIHYHWTHEFEEITKTLVIAGHSAGAALATFAAIDMVQHLISDISIFVYTFGSPRVGNQAFATFYESLGHDMTEKNSNEDFSICYPFYTFRIANVNDIVTHLPISDPWMQYKHVGDAYEFYNDEGIVHNHIISYYSMYQIFENCI